VQPPNYTAGTAHTR